MKRASRLDVASTPRWAHPRARARRSDATTRSRTSARSSAYEIQGRRSPSTTRSGSTSSPRWWCVQGHRGDDPSSRQGAEILRLRHQVRQSWSRRHRAGADNSRPVGYTPRSASTSAASAGMPHAYERHIAAAARIARSGIELAFNLGGGCGPIRPPKRRRCRTISDHRNSEGQSAIPPELIIEPGRALVTSSTSLLLRVKHTARHRSIQRDACALVEVKFMHFTRPPRLARRPRAPQRQQLRRFHHLV